MIFIFRLICIASAILCSYHHALSQTFVDSFQWIKGGQHIDDYRGLAVANNYASFATLGLHGEIKLWDFQTCAPLRVIGQSDSNGLAGFVTSFLAFSHDDTKLFARLSGKNCVFDVATGKLLFSFSQDGSVADPIRESPDGKYLVMQGNSWVIYENIDGAYQLYSTISRGNSPSPTSFLEFSQDSKYLFVPSSTGSGIDLFDLKTKSISKHLNASHQPITSGTLSIDGKTLFVVEAAGAVFPKLKKIDWTNDNVLKEITLISEYIENVTPSGNGDIVLVKYKEGLEFFSTNNLDSLSAISAPFMYYNAISYSADTILVGNERSLSQLDRTSGSQIRSVFPYGVIKDMLYTSDGKHLIVSARQRYIDFYDSESGESELFAIGDSAHTSKMALSKDRSHLLVTGQQSKIRIYNLESLSPEGIIELPFPPSKPDFLTCLTTSSDYSMVAAGALDSNIYIWDREQNIIVKIIHTSSIPQALAFDSEDDYLGVGVGTGNDGMGYVFKSSNWSEALHTLLNGSVHSVFFRKIAPFPPFSNDSTIVSFDAAEDGPTYFVKDNIEAKINSFTKDGFYGRKFSSDGNFLFRSSYDSIIQVNDVRQPENSPSLFEFSGYPSHFPVFAISPDSKWLAAGLDDGTFMEWALPEDFRSVINRNYFDSNDEIASIFPCPADRNVTLAIKEHFHTQPKVSVIDLNGRYCNEISFHQTSENFYSVITDKLPTGGYFIATKADGKNFFKFFLIRH